MWLDCRWLFVEASLVVGLMLFLFHLRHNWGLSPLYIALGVFQQMQVVLANSIYLEIAPGIVVSPGSVVLFTLAPIMILVVYIHEDVSETRKLIYGLLFANLILSLFSWVVSLHIGSPATRNVYGLPRGFFVQNLRITVVGTLTLLTDAVLIMASGGKEFDLRD